MILSFVKNFYFKFKFYIAIALGLIGAWFVAKSMGKKEQLQENYKEKMEENEKKAAVEIIKQKKTNEAVVEAVENSNDVKNENARLSDDDAINKLRDKWSRD